MAVNISEKQKSELDFFKNRFSYKNIDFRIKAIKIISDALDLKYSTTREDTIIAIDHYLFQITRNRILTIDEWLEKLRFYVKHVPKNKL